jgi:hypothetical protein
MKQLQKALRNAGFVAYIDDDNVMLVGHKRNSITFENILGAIYPLSINHKDYNFVQVDGIVKIYHRNNKPGPTPHNNNMFRPQIGPTIDTKTQQVRDWFESLSPEARMMQLVYRYEDWYRDQQQALEWSRNE